MTKIGNIQTSAQKHDLFNVFLMYALVSVHEKFDV